MKTTLIALLALPAVLAAGLFLSCAPDSDDSSATRIFTADGTWYNHDATAVENCRAFYAMYLACVDAELAPAVIDGVCADFAYWEQHAEQGV